MSRATVLQLPRQKSVLMAQSDNLKFMRPLKDGSMQLIVTSPPYNIGKVYEKRSSLDAYSNAGASHFRVRTTAEFSRIVVLASWESYRQRRDRSLRYSFVSGLSGTRLEASEQNRLALRAWIALL
jgi:hypothetical protein